MTFDEEIARYARHVERDIAWLAGQEHDQTIRSSWRARAEHMLVKLLATVSLQKLEHRARLKRTQFWA